MTLLESARRTTLTALVVITAGLLTMGAGCSSDPNVEGAKLDLRNKDYDRALVNLDAALESDPNNYEAYHLKGQVYQEMAGVESDPEAHTELIQNMAGAYQMALDNAPAEGSAELREDISSRMRLGWYNEYQRGLAQYNREDYEVAARYFINATELQPDSSATYVNLAFAYISGGEASRAIEPLEMAIAHGDRNPDTYNYLADLYMEEDRFDDSIALLNDARMEFPDNTEVTSRLFNAYARTGQLEQALPIAAADVEREPDNAQHHYNYGSLLLEAEQYDNAIEHLRKAVEIDPANTSALFNLGAAYQNKGVELNDRVTTLDEQIRNDELSEVETEERQSQMEAAAAERDELFAMSIDPLVKARSMAEQADDADLTGICNALGQAYARTNDMEKAQEAYACAEGN